MSLLIRPLWNWNEVIKGIHIIVIKLLIRPLWNWNRILFLLKLRNWATNQTIVELKLTFDSSNSPVSGFSTNQTIVELKLCFKGTCILRVVLLIRPLWNWNKTRSRSRILSPWLLIRPLWNWNNCTRRENLRAGCLLIRPLWNWNHTNN